jgi:hypothetical protein
MKSVRLLIANREIFSNMSQTKGIKGSNMRFHIFVLFLLCLASTVNAAADDALYLHLECSPGQACINLPYRDNGEISVLATPALMLGKADVKLASVQTYEDAQMAIIFELHKEAAGVFEKVTGENIGKKLAVVFHDKILTAPTIRESIGGGKIKLDGGKDPFWKEAPWLQDLIMDSYKTNGRSVMVYVIVALAVSISAFVFILLPRMKRVHQSIPCGKPI